MELWVFTFPIFRGEIRGEAMSYDGEFPNHMMAIKTGSFPPFYIIGDFAGGNRNANLISIESADSRLDS